MCYSIDMNDNKELVYFWGLIIITIFAIASIYFIDRANAEQPSTGIETVLGVKEKLRNGDITGAQLDRIYILLSDVYAKVDRCN